MHTRYSYTYRILRMPTCSGRALVEDVRDSLDRARLASLIPLRPPTDDPLRRGLFYRPLSLLRRPSGLRTWTAAVPALHRRPGSACCQSRPVIPLLCRRLSAIHVGASIDSCTAAASNGARYRADRRMDAFQKTAS